MSSNETTLGSGVLKTSARPIRVHVSENGEYWLCDEHVDRGSDYRASGCLAHSSVPMAEGG